MSILSLETGMRAGDIFHMDWRDVNMIQKHILIRGENAKTSKDRYVFMTKAVLLMLSERIPKANGLVFPDRNGNPRKEVSNAFDRACDAVGINDNATGSKDRFVFHGWRHQFASRLVQERIDLFKVAKLMGHASILMVEQRYGHLRPDDLRNAVLVFEKKDPKAEKPERLILMV